ncbi:MAG: hypothetical protein JOZ02_13185 [Acidobacteria bacterium]|nr:hypothetical protein [Acidobacteriota bacterium]
MSRGSNTEQGAVTGRTLDEVEAELSEAAAALQTLKAERDALPGQAEEARAALDSWRLGELEARGRELGGQIDEGQARLWLLQAERARLLLPEAEARAAAAKVEYDRAHAEYLEAHARTNRLGVEYDNAQAQALRLRESAEENERRARELASGLARQS